MSQVKYRWATLGVGVIGHELAEAMQALGGSLYAVGNRTHAKAEAFAQQYGIGRVYAQPEDMFTDPDIDIVYISTPHNTHLPFLRQALAAGKHVLCEKAITLNSAELEEAVALAKKHNVVLGEAQTVYHMPIHQQLAARQAAGEFGPLRVMTLNFGSYKPYNMENRFFNRHLAGGAMLDIGVYALSTMRWYMSAAPTQMATQVRYAPTGVDEQASMLLQNDAGEMATIMLSLHAKQPKRVTLSFDKAYVEIYNYPRGDKAVITWTADGHTEELTAGDTARALQYEILDMERAVAGEPERMHLDYTRDVMQLMTQARAQWGMCYPEEE